MSRTERQEAALLLFGFCFQAAGVAALLLSTSVQAGEWGLNSSYLVALIPLAVWGASAWVVHRQLNRALPGRDPLLFPAAMFLCGWGLQILARLSPNTALRQTVWLVVGCAVLLFFVRFPGALESLRKYRYLWLMAALSALAATFLAGVGSEPGTPRLWLGLDGIYFQPSEFLRWMFPVFAAATLAPNNRPDTAPRWRRTLPVILFGSAGLILLLLQPDFGAGMLFFFGILIVLYLAHRKGYLPALGGLCLAAAGAAGYLLNETVRARILTWWNPWLDASNTSYQVVQSLISIAAGGLIGRGPGLGAPRLVPVAYSDFIFSALSEEYGIVGAVGCLLILSILVLRGLRVAARVSDPGARILAGSLSALLGLQSILIIGGVIRLIPLTGVTLPWMSYGGSSLLSSMVILTFLLSFSAETLPAPCESGGDHPFRILAALHIGAVAAIAVSLGWWGVYRAPVLLTRTDNVRRVIHDAQARRGGIYDRNGSPLAVSVGTAGNYLREYPAPTAAPVVGYSSARYGQGGLEAALDPWLRGEASRNAFESWWLERVLGTPAAGASARLTLDLTLQESAGSLLPKQPGAVIIMRARSGDILTLVSQPTYNPATLESDWSRLLANPLSPLMNRVTQGLYPPGRILLPFLAAEALDEGWQPASGDLCDPSLAAFYSEHPEVESTAFQRFRFGEAPVMDLPTAHSPVYISAMHSGNPFAGESGEWLVSPVQIALALASLTAEGKAPAPRIVLSLEDSTGWVDAVPPGHPMAMIPADIAERTVSLIRRSSPLGNNGVLEIPVCPQYPAGGEEITWYVGSRSLGEENILIVIVVEGRKANLENLGRLLLERARVSLLNVPGGTTPSGS